MSNTDIESLHEELGRLADKAKSIRDAAAGRDMTPVEVADMDAVVARFNATEAQVKGAALDQRIDDLAQPNRRVTQPDDVPMSNATRRPARSITGGVPVASTHDSWGWESPQSFIRGVFAASRGVPDRRLMNAPSTFGSEGVNEDGGFAVPPDFRANIMSILRSDTALLSFTDQQFTDSNAIELPTDSVSAHDTSAGIQCAWTGEAATIAQSKPKLGSMTVRVHKLAALVGISDELLSDASALTGWMPAKVAEKFTSRINTAIVSGDGIAKPMGLLNSACKITQTAETGQGAGTINSTNVVKMMSRLPASSRKNAIWIVHPDALTQLAFLTMPGASPNAALFMPGGSMVNAGPDRLLGAPIVQCEAASALGTEGDIILADLTQYLTAQKTGGLRADTSIHVWFDQGVSAFRFVLRIGGQSYWPAAVARQNGSSTMSPIVTLSSSRT